MATVNGTTSQRTSIYDFYFTYDTSFSSSKMQWTVKVKVYLEVDTYKYSGNTSHSLSIGGTTVDKESNYTKTCGDSSSKKTYLIAEGFKTYAASSSDRSVKIEASMTAPSGGHGPGTCKASKTITLPAKLVKSGELSLSDLAQHSVTIKVTGLKTGLGYARTAKFYYKRAEASSWISAGSDTASSSDSNVSLTITKKLISNYKYNFKVNIYTPTGTLLQTFTTTATTSKDNVTFAKSSVTENSVKVVLSGLVETVYLKRVLKFYYRRKGATNWTALSSKTHTIASGDAAKAVTVQVANCAAGTTYQFKVELWYGAGYLASSATCEATTVRSDISDTAQRVVTATLYKDTAEFGLTCVCDLEDRPIQAVSMTIYLGQPGKTYVEVGRNAVGYYTEIEFIKPLVPESFPPLDSYNVGDPVKVVWINNVNEIVAIDQLELNIA